MKDVSILIPAHNEEKVIHNALNQLAKIKSSDIEVLVGLDGCTDGTKAVVQNYDFVKYLELDKRSGKPAVLHELMKVATGRIFIIHDADWRFVSSRDGFKELMKCFDDLRVGGIVLPNHEIPFLEMRKEIRSFDYLGAALGAFFLTNFLFKLQTKKIDGKLYVDNRKIVYPFPLNITRASSFRATTVADDFERFMFFVKNNYLIRVFNDKDLPYFEITDKQLVFSDHLKQRIKGHLARAQFERKYKFNLSISKFYLPFILYIIKNLPMIRIRGSVAIIGWCLTILLAFFKAKIIMLRGIPSAKEAWKYRLKRSG